MGGQSNFFNYTDDGRFFLPSYPSNYKYMVGSDDIRDLAGLLKSYEGLEKEVLRGIFLDATLPWFAVNFRDTGEEVKVGAQYLLMTIREDKVDETIAAFLKLNPNCVTFGDTRRIDPSIENVRKYGYEKQRKRKGEETSHSD